MPPTAPAYAANWITISRQLRWFERRVRIWTRLCSLGWVMIHALATASPSLMGPLVQDPELFHTEVLTADHTSARTSSSTASSTPSLPR